MQPVPSIEQRNYQDAGLAVSSSQKIIQDSPLSKSSNFLTEEIFNNQGFTHCLSIIEQDLRDECESASTHDSSNVSVEPIEDDASLLNSPCSSILHPLHEVARKIPRLLSPHNSSILQRRRNIFRHAVLEQLTPKRLMMDIVSERDD